MKILVATDRTADDRKTLAAVRALGRAGAEVRVGSDVSRNPPLWSRHCRGRVRFPSPTGHRDRFIEWLLHHLAEEPYDAVLPLSDYTTMPMVAERESIEVLTRLAVPDAEPMRLAHDKLALLGLARSLGIEVPDTFCPQDRRELETISDEVDYPCVFKLRRGAGAEGLAFPSSAAELLDHFDALEPKEDDVVSTARPLVQQYIPGTVHDVCALFFHGEPRAVLTQQRILMHPASGGPGIYIRTTDEPLLRERAIALLTALNWHGPAQVEFKKDSRDGSYQLLEVNARYWGTLDVSIRAGINFPLLACRMAIDGDVESVTEYRKGVSYRWPLPWGMRYALNSPHPWRAIRPFIAPGRPTYSDWQLSDPLPNLIQTFLTAPGFKRMPTTAQ